MKSFRFLLITALVLVFTNTNAQLFVGGSMGINTSGGKHDNGNTETDKPSSFAFSFNPKMGYFISEKFAVGAELYFGFTKENDNLATETIEKSTTIGIAPFARYYIFKINKFSVFGIGSLGISNTSYEVKFNGNVVSEPKTFNIGFNVRPGLSYDLTEKFSLETTLNFLNFGYIYSRTKEDDTKDTSSNFSFNVGMDNVTTIGNITIGAIYHF